MVLDLFMCISEKKSRETTFYGRAKSIFDFGFRKRGINIIFFGFTNLNFQYFRLLAFQYFDVIIIRAEQQIMAIHNPTPIYIKTLGLAGTSCL